MKHLVNVKDMVLIAAGFSFAFAFIIILLRKYLFRKASLLNVVVLEDNSKIYKSSKKFVSDIEIMANNFRYRARRNDVRSAGSVGQSTDVEYGEYGDRNSDYRNDIDDSKEEVTDFVE